MLNRQSVHWSSAVQQTCSSLARSYEALHKCLLYIVVHNFILDLQHCRADNTAGLYGCWRLLTGGVNHDANDHVTLMVTWYNMQPCRHVTETSALQTINAMHTEHNGTSRPKRISLTCNQLLPSPRSSIIEVDEHLQQFVQQAMPQINAGSTSNTTTVAR